MMEIKYLSKNPKGFSVDDIKGTELKRKGPVEYTFKSGKSIKKVFLNYYDNCLYVANSTGQYGSPFLFSSSKINDFKEKIKIYLLKEGFKDKDNENIVLRNNVILDLSENIPEYIIAFKSKSYETFNNYFSKIFFEFFEKREKAISIKMDRLKTISEEEGLGERYSKIKTIFERKQNDLQINNFCNKELEEIEKNRKVILDQFKSKDIGIISLAHYITNVKNLKEFNYARRPDVLKKDLKIAKDIYLNLFTNITEADIRELHSDYKTNDFEKLREYNEKLFEGKTLKEKFELQEESLNILSDILEKDITKECDHRYVLTSGKEYCFENTSLKEILSDYKSNLNNPPYSTLSEINKEEINKIGLIIFDKDFRKEVTKEVLNFLIYTKPSRIATDDNDQVLIKSLDTGDIIILKRTIDEIKDMIEKNSDIDLFYKELFDSKYIEAKTRYRKKDILNKYVLEEKIIPLFIV